MSAIIKAPNQCTALHTAVDVVEVATNFYRASRRKLPQLAHGAKTWQTMKMQRNCKPFC